MVNRPEPGEAPGSRGLAEPGPVPGHRPGPPRRPGQGQADHAASGEDLRLHIGSGGEHQDGWLLTATGFTSEIHRLDPGRSALPVEAPDTPAAGPRPSTSRR